MVALGSPHPVTKHVHVAVMTHTEYPRGITTKQELVYGLPGNGHVQMTYHTIHKDRLELLSYSHPEAKRNHQMSDVNLKKLKEDTEANKPYSWN